MTGISWADLITSFFILFGLFFVFAGSLGLVRFPDVYTRLHAPTKGATLGVFGILVASIIHLAATGSWGVKEILTIVFLFLTAPVSAHMMSRAAYITGVPAKAKIVTNDLKDALPIKEEAMSNGSDPNIQG